MDYTEDATPYASHFRPHTPVLTVTDALNMGSISTSPSSTKLFFDWYVFPLLLVYLFANFLPSCVLFVLLAGLVIGLLVFSSPL